MPPRLVLAFAVIAVLFGGASIAAAQEPSPSAAARIYVPPLYLRSGLILMSLAAASAGTSAALLATQPDGTWAEGAGIAHALFAGSYAVDATIRLIAFGRARRSKAFYGLDAPVGWGCWLNLFVTAGLTTAGALVAALSGDDAGRGVGSTFAVHGAWMFAWSLTRVVRVRRQRPLWMALTLGGVRF